MRKQDNRRVQNDTGPLRMGLEPDDRDFGPRPRVWHWYVGGTAMLAGALAIALTDFHTSSHAAPVELAANTPPKVEPARPAPALAPAPAPAPTLARALTAPAPAPSPAPAPAPAASAPAVAREPAKTDSRELAKNLNSLGFAARKDGDHANARMLYREAADADPEHVWSRYNLACEHALLGENAEALALLQRIADIGGEDADEALYEHAPKDKDFIKLRKHSKFRTLTTRR